MTSTMDVTEIWKSDSIFDCKNSQSVYEFLKGRGIKGKRGNIFSCPVANYLEEKYHLGFDVDHHYISCNGGYKPTTTAISTFIVYFDKGSSFKDLDINAT